MTFGALNGQAWLLAGATLCEIVVPLLAYFVLVRYGLNITNKTAQTVFLSTYYGFVISLCTTYILVMLTHASMLMSEPDIGLNGAAPRAFQARVGSAYMRTTFLEPAQEMLALAHNVTGNFTDEYCDRAQVALSQIISWVS